jgi:Zn finger protein HypA/HybF involved in hydrogenase expression
MTKQAYQSKGGDTLYRPNMTQREAEKLMVSDEMLGWCLGCGSEQEPVEPDAERYRCESCGAMKVYGIEQLVLRGIARVDGEVVA